jgi:hypothetical protein
MSPAGSWQEDSQRTEDLPGQTEQKRRPEPLEVTYFSDYARRHERQDA